MSKDNIPEAGYVTVACKLPHGLILQLYDMIDSQEPVMGGGFRTVKVSMKVFDPVRIRGNAVPFGKTPNFDIRHTFALTPNVDAKFFSRWMDQNKDHDAVKNGLIFAHAKTESAISQAKENRGILSGLEPLDMSKVFRNGEKVNADMRVPRPTSSNLSEIEQATRE